MEIQNTQIYKDIFRNNTLHMKFLKSHHMSNYFKYCTDKLSNNPSQTLTHTPSFHRSLWQVKICTNNSNIFNNGNIIQILKSACALKIEWNLPTRHHNADFKEVPEITGIYKKRSLWIISQKNQCTAEISWTIYSEI